MIFFRKKKNKQTTVDKRFKQEKTVHEENKYMKYYNKLKRKNNGI